MISRLARIGRALAHNRDGGAAILVAGALPMLIAGAALAVDIGAVQLESRALQGIADNAALAAARHPGRAQAAVDAVVAQAGWAGRVTAQIDPGNYRPDPAVPVDNRFTPGGSSGNAVRVALTAQSPTYFAAVFGRPQVTIGRIATAARQDYAAFSIGSRLAALNGGIANALLSGLLGTSISLSAMDYNALVSADVDLLRYADALATRANLDVGTYDAILASQVSGSAAIQALADSVQDVGLAAKLRAIATGASGDSFALDALVDLGPLGGRDTGPAGTVKLDALSMLRAIAELGARDRQVDVDLGATLPGLASTRVRIAIGERPAQSPMIAVSEAGTPIIRTSQARLLIQARLQGAAIPGLGSHVGVDLPLFVELAAGEARVDAVHCDAGRPEAVTLGGRPGLGQIAIAQPDMTAFDDFTRAVPLGKARMVNLLGLVRVDGYAQVDLGTAEPWQQVDFARNDIDTRTIKTVSSGAAVTGLAASLTDKIAIEVRALGLLPVPVTPIVQAVGGLVSTIAPAIDGLLNAVLDMLGLRYGQADLRVTGVRCGQPALVA